MTKRLLWAVAVLVAAAAPAPAPAAEGPWCAVVSIGLGSLSRDCHFRTFEECVPHVLGGNRGFCEPNPDYTGPISAPKRKIHPRRRTRH